MRAPLNSRVSSIAAPKTKKKAKQESLERVPLEIQEAMILEDLLYVLMVRHDYTESRSPAWLKLISRESKEYISHTTLITRLKTMTHCKAFVSSCRRPLVRFFLMYLIAKA